MKVVIDLLSEFIGTFTGFCIVVLVLCLYGSYIRKMCCPCCQQSEPSSSV
ncbi:uncharacterized protein LOC111831109 [Capsella rubella]|nr:uncharacterized protein LOC111831109 [Capsella rubella]